MRRMPQEDASPGYQTQKNNFFKDPYATEQLPSARTHQSQPPVSSQNILAGGNTINNNFNIINNIMQVNNEKQRKQPDHIYEFDETIVT